MTVLWLHVATSYKEFNGIQYPVICCSNDGYQPHLSFYSSIHRLRYGFVFFLKTTKMREVSVSAICQGANFAISIF
jgi:hypothetical protein